MTLTPLSTVKPGDVFFTDTQDIDGIPNGYYVCRFTVGIFNRKVWAVSVGYGNEKAKWEWTVHDTAPAVQVFTHYTEVTWAAEFRAEVQYWRTRLTRESTPEWLRGDEIPNGTKTITN